MERKMLKHRTRLLLKQKRRKLWHKVVGVLACFVVFCTSYALILPAITMEKPTYCGMEEHQHDESCYTTTETLICGLDEGAIVEAPGGNELMAAGDIETPTDPVEEVSETAAASEAHVHTEACYQYGNVSNCMLEEHTHTLACYSNKNADVETADEWESGLPALTGDRAADFVRVAESQVGYTESSANYEVAEEDVLKGYTRYGAWYGNPYGDWSGMFVAFCLNYAGISQSIFPYDTDCQSWANTLAQYGMYAATGSYTPKAGDNAFLDTDGTAGADHVGIITNVSADGTLTVVVGDFQNSVQYASYTATSGNVAGYGILPVEEATGEQTEELEDETKESVPQEMTDESIVTLEFVGEDYKVTVTYDENAGIPEGAVLKVAEYAQDSEEYQTRFDEANAVLLNQDGSCIRRARFFDISIMDGETKIEPANTVRVEISQSADITENIAGAGDIVITHATDEGTEVISGVEQIEEENGYVTASFETESFSDFGTISAGQSVTIGVGDTVTLQGKASSGGTVNTWSAQPAEVVNIEKSGANDAVITGMAIGKVTITHEYSTKKNKTAKETFTVTVEDKGNTDVEVEKGAAGTGYTVTVKGNKKVLTDDVTLHVEDYGNTESDYQEYYDALVKDMQTATSSVIDNESFGFLHMYHIYLTKDGVEGEYIPESNINLQVTITYDSTPDGWPSGNGNLYVGHYKKNGNSIENKGFTDADGIKQIRVSGSSITFHIQSFSIITASKLASSEDTSSTIQNDVELNYVSGTLRGADINGYDSTGANNWQVSTVGAYQSVNGTRVAKYVEPTNIEDVFKVTVAVERNAAEAELQKVLKSIPAYIINENKNKVDSAVGTIIEPKEYQSGDCYGSTDESKALSTNDYFYIHYLYTFTEDGMTITRDLGQVKMYRAFGKNAGQNHGIVAILPNGQWIVVDTEDFKWGDHGTHNVVLSQEQYEALLDAVTPEVSVNGVTDYLDTGRYIYIGTEVSDSKSTSSRVPTVSLTGTFAVAPDSNGKISWSGEGWKNLKSTDTATMTYYVRLKTSTIDGAASDIDAMTFDGTPVNNTGMAYSLAAQKTKAEVTARQAVIENNTIVQKETNCTPETEQPSVKGLLYYINLQKIEKDSEPVKAVSGAKFAIYSGDDITGIPVATITTGEDGYGLSNPGLPWGTYTVVETFAPEGYKLPENTTIGTYSLAYTGNGQGIQALEVVDGTKPGKNLTGTESVKNEILTAPLNIVKTDSSGEPIEGAKFTWYEGDEIKYTVLCSDKDGILKMDGSEVKLILRGDTTYYLEETDTPNGFRKLDDRIKITLSSDDDGEVVISAKFENDSSKTYEVTVPEDDETPYILTVVNSRNDVRVTLIKVGLGDGEQDIDKAVPLAGAKFKLYKDDTDVTDRLLDASESGTGIFSSTELRLENGSYSLVEETAPDGYYKIINEIHFAIDTSRADPEDVITSSSSASNINISCDTSGTEPVYTVKIINRTGVELPSTGGTGTLAYTFGGLGLILISGLMYGYSMRRKRERRSM